MRKAFILPVAAAAVGALAAVGISAMNSAMSYDREFHFDVDVQTDFDVRTDIGEEIAVEVQAEIESAMADLDEAMAELEGAEFGLAAEGALVSEILREVESELQDALDGAELTETERQKLVEALEDLELKTPPPAARSGQGN